MKTYTQKQRTKFAIFIYLAYRYKDERGNWQFHKNFMSPNLDTYGGNHRYAYEISWGSGFSPETAIVGISIVQIFSPNSANPRHDLSTSIMGDRQELNELLQKARLKAEFIIGNDTDDKETS